MPAYVISEVDVVDESAARHYMKFAQLAIAEYGGRYLVRGAQAEVMEGDPIDRKIIIVEFPSLERVREWYASSAYAKALQYRERPLRRKLTFVDGTTPFSDQ